MEYDAFDRLEGTTKVEIDTSIIDATNVDMPQGKLEAIRGGAKHCQPKRYRPKIVSKRAFDQVRDADGTNVFLRFEQMLHRVDRMVADSELVWLLNYLIYKEFTNLETDEEPGAEFEELY